MGQHIRWLRRATPLIALAIVITLTSAPAQAVPIVSIGNGPAAPDGSYLNSTNIANTLAFTIVNVSATTSIDIADPIDISTSPSFGTTFFNLSLAAPTVNLNNNINLSASSNLVLPGVSTFNLTGKVTNGATVLGPTRFLSNSAVTQVNVLASTASIQQAVDLSSATSPVTVAITTGQSNETVSISKSLTLSTSAPAGHINNGDLRLLSSAATITLSGSAFSNAAGGALHGIGTLNASTLTGSGFINHGAVAPGLSAGTRSFTGAYTQASDGDFQIEIGGTTAGTQYDRLAVSGAASLAGQLHVSLISGFVPGAIDTFTILTSASRTGTFSNAVTSVATGTGVFDVTYTPTSVVLGNFHVPEPALLGGFALFPLLISRRRKHARCA
jgi:hypothetical protein